MRQDGVHCETGVVTIEPMAIADLVWVLEIERHSFPSPWSEESFRHELQRNPYASLFVVRVSRIPGVVGYASVWIVDKELRINNIAIHRKSRRQGIGTLLLAFLFDHASRDGCMEATLEVRPSNVPALRVYARAGFHAVGRRRGYYLDTHEDAVIMSRPLGTPCSP